MMELKSSLRALSLILLSSIAISGCSTPNSIKEVITVTEVIRPIIPQVERPKQLSFSEVRFYVVTEETLGDFKLRFMDDHGEFVFYAISVKDYESLSLNMAELKRYILQQKDIILYYEESVAPKEEPKDEK
jgi:hypothetical protein